MNPMKTPDTIAQDCAEAFLRWPLPESVHSDLCATMKGPNRYGTHLINYDEAEQMAREVMLPIIAAEIREATEQKDREIARLNAYIKKIDGLIEEVGGCTFSCINPYEDLKASLVGLKTRVTELERQLAEAGEDKARLLRAVFAHEPGVCDALKFSAEQRAKRFNKAYCSLLGAIDTARARRDGV